MRYLRAAALPALVLTALFCWGLPASSRSGWTARRLRAAGRAGRVLGPGCIWPAMAARQGAPRRVRQPCTKSRSAANRAWRRRERRRPRGRRRLGRPAVGPAHPGEVTYLIASEAEGRQGFQIVNADLRVLMRIGLDRRDPVARAGTADPSPWCASDRAAHGALLRRPHAGRHFWANGARRWRRLSLRTPADLAPLSSGIEILDVAIEAVHPPAGAAVAYHEVQAAAVKARNIVAEAQGAAKAQANETGQQARQVSDSGQAAAAETVQAAQAERIRFGADRAANAAGGGVFLLERYFADLGDRSCQGPAGDPGRSARRTHRAGDRPAAVGGRCHPTPGRPH